MEARGIRVTVLLPLKGKWLIRLPGLKAEPERLNGRLFKKSYLMMLWAIRLRGSTGRDATSCTAGGRASVNHDRVIKGIYETDDEYREAFAWVRLT